MNFKYTTPEYRKPIAAIHAFDGDPHRECLVIQTTTGKTIWFHPDGDISVQMTSPEFEGNPKKLFYPGDSITITF